MSQHIVVETKSVKFLLNKSWKMSEKLKWKSDLYISDWSLHVAMRRGCTQDCVHCERETRLRQWLPSNWQGG